jgi:hypothetical protein
MLIGFFFKAMTLNDQNHEVIKSDGIMSFEEDQAVWRKLRHDVHYFDSKYVV